MTNRINLDELAKRPVRYLTQTGLNELFLGMMMLVPACLFGLAKALLPKKSVFFMLVPCAWGGSIFLIQWSFNALRDRVVFPRGGYVGLSKPGRLRVAVFFFVVAASSIALGFTHKNSGGFLIPALAVALALSFCMMGIEAKLPHLVVIAAVPLLALAWIYQSNMGKNESYFCILAASGGAPVLGGALRLRSFLKANPRAGAGA